MLIAVKRKFQWQRTRLYVVSRHVLKLSINDIKHFDSLLNQMLNAVKRKFQWQRTRLYVVSRHALKLRINDIKHFDSLLNQMLNAVKRKFQWPVKLNLLSQVCRELTSEKANGGEINRPTENRLVFQSHFHACPCHFYRPSQHWNQRGYVKIRVEL